jgi:hypothetical protein
MSQNHPLDNIVRVVDSKYEITRPEERVVVIDPDSKQATDIRELHKKTPVGSRRLFGLLGTRRHVLVINNSDSRKEVEVNLPTLYLRDFARQWSLGIQVQYQASCSPGNEMKVAEVLGSEAHPGTALDDLIARWLKDYAGPQPGALIENFYEKKYDLAGNLTARALSEVGLSLQVRLKIESEREALAPIRVGDLRFRVKLKDYDIEQDLKVDAEIEVDPDRKIYAVLYHAFLYESHGTKIKEPARLEELLKTETREFFTETTLHSFNSELRTSGLRDQLVQRLNDRLRRYGRRIKSLTLDHKSEIEGLSQAFFETQEIVNFDEIQEYEGSVPIMNKVQMTLHNYGLYKSAGCPNLNAWIKKNLPEVVKHVLFGKRYIDLLIGFDRPAGEIKLQLSARAEAIGYSIKQLITLPALPPYEWLDNFKVNVENQQYETNTSKFVVGLGIYVTVRIRRLEDIETYLNRRQHIPQLMEEALITEARQLLHTIDPERFYMRFGYSESGEETVEDLLRKQISERLEKSFAAEVISIVFKMTDTAITDRWASLETAEGKLKIELPSFSDVEEVTYLGRVRVEAIHETGWHKFRRTSPTMESLCERLEEHVLAKLGTFSNADTVYTNFRGHEQIEQIVEGLAKKFAVEEFGLLIRVTSIRREATGIERLERDRIQGILVALNKLENDRMQEIINGGSIEKIKRLEERIQKLESELPGSVKATRMKFTRPELEAPAAPSRLADYFEVRKSIGAGSGANGDTPHEEVEKSESSETNAGGGWQ